MRKQIAILVFLLLMGSTSIIAANPKFFVVSVPNNKTAKAYADWLEYYVIKNIRKEMPCADVSSQSTVADVLKLERQKELLGAGDQDAIANLGAAVGCDYLVSMKVDVSGNQATISGISAETRNSKVIVRINEVSALAEPALDAVEKVAKALVDGLKKYEICPFKGPIDVKIITSHSYSQPVQHAVYCNGMEGLYKKTTSLSKYSESDWAIQKNGKEASSGTFKYYLNEEQTVEEQNNCYDCSPTKQGWRVYSEKISTKANIAGLSNESECAGIKVDDARAEITFLDNDTYIIRVKATSKKGIKTRKKEIHAEGVCDFINAKPETTTRKVEEGINQIFGPFPGTAFDKVLSQKNTIKKTSAITGEEETISYEFNLKKD